MSKSDLEAQIEKLAKLRLQDLVAEDRRDVYSVQLAPLEVIQSLRGAIELGPVKRQLEIGWLIEISMTTADEREAYYVLLAHDWVTSRVQALDLDRGLVKTLNSVYGIEHLETRKEPPPEACRMLATALTTWGVGRQLGTPEFFF